MLNRRFDSRNLTVRVINLDTGREDVHKNISYDEMEWIRLNPNLQVDILEEESDTSDYEN